MRKNNSHPFNDRFVVHPDAVVRTKDVRAGMRMVHRLRYTQVDNSKFPQVTVYVSVTNASRWSRWLWTRPYNSLENGQISNPPLCPCKHGGVGPSHGPLLIIDIFRGA